MLSHWFQVCLSVCQKTVLCLCFAICSHQNVIKACYEKKKSKSVASSPAERKLEMQMLVWMLTLHAASTFADLSTQLNRLVSHTSILPSFSLMVCLCLCSEHRINSCSLLLVMTKLGGFCLIVTREICIPAMMVSMDATFTAVYSK